MTNYTVVLRERKEDANGRKNTKRIVVRARNSAAAWSDTLRKYSVYEWEIMSIEARDGSGQT